MDIFYNTMYKTKRNKADTISSDARMSRNKLNLTFVHMIVEQN